MYASRVFSCMCIFAEMRNTLCTTALSMVFVSAGMIACS